MAKVIVISAGLIGIIWILVGGPCVCAAADATQCSAAQSSLDSLSRVSLTERIARMPVTSVADILRTQVWSDASKMRRITRVCRATPTPYASGNPCFPSYAPPVRMLDSMYHAPGQWALKADCVCDRWKYDLNDDGNFDLLDVVLSTEWEFKWEQWSGTSRAEAIR